MNAHLRSICDILTRLQFLDLDFVETVKRVLSRDWVGCVEFLRSPMYGFEEFSQQVLC